MPYPQTWNLNSLLQNTGSSHAQIEERLNRLAKEIESLQVSPKDPKFYLSLQSIHETLSEAISLIGCLTAQDTKDTKALKLESMISEIASSLSLKEIDLEIGLREMSDTEFDKIFSSPEISEIKFYFAETREFAQKKLPPNEERIINNLSPSGHDVFTSLYYTYLGEIQFDFRGEKLTLGPLENKLGSADRSVRLDAMHSLENHLVEKEGIFAQFLGSIIDFRNKVYDARGWKSPLVEALQKNRMQEKTLRTMWDVVKANHPRLMPYVEKKCELLGISKLSWCDFDAPLPFQSGEMSYDEGVDFIIKHFNKLSPKTAAFSKNAVTQEWIEAENRSGKRAGGFCTPCSLRKESRIFMNYAGTMSSVATLAHELGHAVHNEIIFERPFFLQDIGMGIAETASTMQEMVVADAAVQEANTRDEKLCLLDDKLSRAITFSMDIYSRYLFDTFIHEERKKRILSAEDFSELMIKAQKEGYSNILDENLPHFWCYKMHHYFTDMPFYNFPYTVGYLFSLGIYQLLTQDPSHFEKRYFALLYDSAAMSLEDLAQKHLDVDLTKPDFWQGAYDYIACDINTFINL